MGSASSRIASRPPHRRPESRRRFGITACLCGSAVAGEAEIEFELSVPSSSAPPSIDYNPSPKRRFSGRLDESITNDLDISSKNLSLSIPTDKGTPSSMTEEIRFTDAIHINNSPENIMQLRDADCLPSNLNGYHNHSVKTSSLPSSSAEPNILESRSMCGSLASPLEISNIVAECDLVAAPLGSSNIMQQLQHGENVNEIAGCPSLTGPIEHIDAGELPADLSNGSAILSSSSGELSNFDARRNSRRRFWDALSRRLSRRNLGSPESLLSTESNASQDRWLFEVDGHTLGNDREDDLMFSRHSRRRRDGLSGLSGNSRSEEIRERIQSGFHYNNAEALYCSSGLHLEGTCSCNTLVASEASNTRSSFARIVMLAEALFEVLDEIHQQPGTHGISAFSVPAPDFVVNSLPLRVYKKIDMGGERADDNEQCHICLAEYEEGESIRILPCHHEYHMSCVDKWLKEIRGVCPLCRGNVAEGTNEGPQ